MTDIISCTNTIKSFDDTELYYTKDFPKYTNAIIIIMHGFSEHIGIYKYIKDRLINYGYGIYLFDIRGHGKSGGKRGYVDNFNHFIDDTDIMVEMIRNENENLPMFIAGYSMGGFIAASYGIKHSDKLNGEILLSAATMKPFFVRGFLGRLCKIINHLHSDFMIKNSIANIFLRDRDTVINYEDEDLKLFLNEATIKFHTEFLVNGIGWLDNNVSNYNLPCLILHGAKDRVIPKKAAVRFHKKISSEYRQIKIYDNIDHKLLNETNRDMVLNDLHMWVTDRI